MEHPLKIVVASHDFRFFAPIRAHIESLSSVEIREDVWTGTRPGDHDEDTSRALLEWADVVICEWCQANAIWYSRGKRPGQRLIVRFHRFEIENDLPHFVDIDAVDLTIFVGDRIMRAARERFGWNDGSRQRVVWNPVDVRALDQPKLPHADTTLGLLGWVPRLKRLDRALDVLEEVRLNDDRFRLLVKGNPAWVHPWIWRRENERWYVEDVLTRIARTPCLRNAVIIEPFGSVVDWFRKVGYILSVSDVESFHMAAAEGMASRAVPVIRRWDGADEIYPHEWVHDDVSAAAASVLVPGWADRGMRAQTVARERFSQDKIFGIWRTILGVSDGNDALHEPGGTIKRGPVPR
jgi:hypothetical protein